MRTKEFTMEELDKKIIEENRKLEELEQSIKQCRENLKQNIKLREAKKKHIPIDMVILACYERVINENGSFLLERGIIPMIKQQEIDHYEIEIDYPYRHEIGMEDMKDEAIERKIPVYTSDWDYNKDDVIYPYARRKMTNEEKENTINDVINSASPFRGPTRDKVLTQKTIKFNSYGNSIPVSKIISDILRENPNEELPKGTITYDDIEALSDYLIKNETKYGINVKFEQENKISEMNKTQIIAPSTEKSRSFKK